MSKIIFFILAVPLLSCNGYVYKEVPRDYLTRYKLERMNRSLNIKYFSATKDAGPPTNIESFIVVEKSGRYYKINPEYICDVLNDSILIIQQSHTTNVSRFGNWVYVKKTLINGQNETAFKYDSIPNIDSDLLAKLNDGIYFLENGAMKKEGELTEFTSLHQLRNDGIYYLTAPGVFYKQKMAPSDFK